MQIEYAVSIWNHNHHASVGRLEDEIALIREQDLGVELWGTWRHERDLYSEENRARLRPVLEGMTVSLHSAFGASWDRHQRQIEAAAARGGPGTSKKRQARDPLSGEATRPSWAIKDRSILCASFSQISIRLGKTS